MKKVTIFIILLFGILSFSEAQIKILFSCRQGESASNADWVIDADTRNLQSNWPTTTGGSESNPQQTPTPAQSGITASTLETYWDGAISAWGVEIAKYCLSTFGNADYWHIESLPYNGFITYGDGANSQDLSNYKVFILDEPNSLFTAAEKTAIVNFVNAGGGLFLVSDHDIADRNGDGQDAVDAINDLLTSSSGFNNGVGITLDYANFSETTTNIPNLPSDPVLHGPSGDVSSIQFNAGTSMTLSPGNNSTVVGVVYKTGATLGGNTDVMAAHAEYGSGRIFVLGDSSPTDDGTGDPNDGLYNNWYDADNSIIITNATIWLANITAGPTLSVTPSSITGLDYVTGAGPSAEQTFSVSGSSLDGSQVTVTAPANFEVSLKTGGPFSASVTIPYTAPTLNATTVYVRMVSGLAVGSYSGNVSLTDNGTASAVSVAVSGNVTSGAAGCASDLIISQVNENGTDKYVEIANFTGASVSLIDYDLVVYANGATAPTSTIDLTDAASIADGDVWVLANANISITADQVSGSFAPNGNDVIALRKTSTNIDVFGTIGDAAYWYDNQQYIRNSNITSPTTTYNAGEWTITAYAGGDPGSLGTHTMSCNTPTLTVTPNSLTGFTYVSGNGPSAEQSFDLTGTNLDGTDVTVSAPLSGNYEISKTSGSGFTTGTLTYSAYSGSTETIYVRLKAGLSVGTYNSEVITVSGGGASDVTVTLDGNVTANSNSDIILETTFTEPSNIPYINYQSANIINDGNDIEVAQFTIRDGGGTNDADNLGTILTDISFSLTNSADIQRVAIYDGATEIAEVAGAATLTFTGITLTAPDNGSKTFSLRVSFNATVTDNDQFQFTVTSATADATGSGFAAADAGGAQSTVVGDENRIEVTATALSFIQQPSNTGINNNMSPDPAVEAIDAKSNRDLDYTPAISVSSTGTMTGDPVAGTWASGVATFANLVHTVLGTGLTLTASDGTLSVVSNTFDITDACANELIISEVDENGSDKYVEIANFTGAPVSLIDYDLVVYANGATTPSSTIDLTDAASIADGDVWVLANANVSITADQVSTSFAPNGNDVIALRKSGANIDVFGVIGDASYWYDNQQYIRNSAVTAPTTSYDVNEWTISAYGGGDPGTLGSHTMSCSCSEPTVQADNLSFSTITATSLTLSWTSGDGVNRIVVCREANAVSFSPVDNTTYTANSDYSAGTEVGTAGEGNKVIYNGSASTVTVTGLTPGTTYYFKIYEYGCQTGTEDYLTSGTPEEGFETTLPNDVTNFQVDCTTSTTANLSWTLPTGNYDGIMIAVLPAATPDNPTCDGVTLTSPDTDFSLASVYCGNASGAVYVYNNVGTTVSITGLTAGTSYHFKAFTYKNSSWSTGTEIIQTAEVSNVSSLSATCGNGESIIAWVNPDAVCFDEVIIAVNTVSVTGTPSGTYTANSLDYTDPANPTLSDGSVIVYNGTVSPQTVTGLTNGTTYFFKVFVRSGADWSSGSEVSCTATTATFFDYGDLAIVGINTHYIDYDVNLADDEIQFVCFKPITTETSIDFTDNGYERLYAGKWADSEGTIRLTRTGPDVPAGTVITVRGRNAASNWHVFIGSGTPNGSLTNDDANWTITDGGPGNNVFDLNINDQIWMMQGGEWINPAGLHNATYTGKVLYGWTAVGWEPAPGYDDTKGSTIFPSSACSVTNLVGVANEDKVRYNDLRTATTQRDWISRFNDEQKWTGYPDSATYQNGGTLPDVITITGSGVSPVAKWTGETSTDWDDCTNWLNLKVPAAGTDVEFVSDDCFNDIVIQPGQTVACNNINISGTTLTHSIKLEGSNTAILEIHGDLTLGGPAGVLDCDDGTAADDGILKIYGDWNENTAGGFLPGNSTVEFNGAIAQAVNTVDATADFYNMTVNNSSAGGVTINDPVSVTGTLSLTSGVLNLNGFNITISGPFTGTNGIFAGNSLSDMTVNTTGAITYGFGFASPQELNTFNMNRTGETAVISTNLTVNTLQIDAGTVELSPGKYYTVNTSLINTPGSAGLVLKSDATGTASLIQPSANIPATCERYLAGGKWNYIFSPLDNVPTSLFNAGNPNFYWYDETQADYWDASLIYGTTGWASESAASMSVSKGYIQYHTATNTYNMTGGNLYNPSSSKVFTLGYTDNGTGSVGLNGVTAVWEDFEGWNLIGNPFTSAFDWNQVTLNNVENVIYFYDGTNYQYFGAGTAYDQGISLNGGSQFVPANQGFFVKATVNNGTVTIPASARTHNSQAFWKKSGNAVENLMKLQIENKGFTDEIAIRTLPYATENHDINYDAYKLFSLDKTKPMIFSRNEDNSHYYAINSLPEFTDEKIIPLGMFIGVDDNYTIRLTENGFDKTHVYLEDKELNEFINLVSEEKYEFWQNASDFSERFNIRFKINTSPNLNSEIPDQVIKTYEEYIYNIPGNMFTDNDLGDKLSYTVTLSDGKPLPSWLKFDTKTMSFSGIPENIQVLNIKITATDIFGASVSDTYKLTVTSSSSIINIDENDVNLYPNPTNGKFVIEFLSPGNAVISIYDISGKTILIENMTSNKYEVDLSGYPKGVYVVNINTGSKLFKKRVVLK